MVGLLSGTSPDMRLIWRGEERRGRGGRKEWGKEIEVEVSVRGINKIECERPNKISQHLEYKALKQVKLGWVIFPFPGTGVCVCVCVFTVCGGLTYSSSQDHVLLGLNLPHL